MTNMALVGTYNFWNVNISGHDQQTQLQDIKDFILDVWDSDIDNSNGDYSLSIGILPDEVNYTVPQSELCDNCTLGTRRDKCHEWAKNKSWYSNFDVVHFIDYYGGDPGTYGNAIIGGADHNNRSALTDCFWDW
ncbi:hypothetical protein [Haloferax sp. YSMS24]